MNAIQFIKDRGVDKAWEAIADYEAIYIINLEANFGIPLIPPENLALIGVDPGDDTPIEREKHLGKVVYEYNGYNNWFVIEEPLGGFVLFMNNSYQNDFTNLEAAQNWIEECEQ